MVEASRIKHLATWNQWMRTATDSSRDGYDNRNASWRLPTNDLDGDIAPDTVWVTVQMFI